MASSPRTPAPDHVAIERRSHFKQTVCLADWWLVKDENDLQGRCLAVAGLTSRGNEPMRVFSSAPIVKRYDIFTAETADGICVIFKGFINKNRTEKNGFPPEVCAHFVYGFPSYWKELEDSILGKESSCKDVLGSTIPRCLSPQYETGSPYPCVDNCEKNSVSKDSQHEIGVTEKQKSKNNEFPTVSPEIPKYSSCLTKGSKYSSTISNIPPKGLEKESYPRTPDVKDHSIPDEHVECGTSEIELLSSSSVGGNIGVDACKGDASGKILLACQLRNRSTDDVKEMESDKSHCKKKKIDKVMNTSREHLTHTEARVRTRSTGRPRMTPKNEEKSGKIVSGLAIRSNCGPSLRPKSLTVDCDPEERRGSKDFDVFSFNMDEIKSCETDVGPAKQELQISSPKMDNDLRKVKNKGSINKAKSKASKMIASAADYQEDNVIPDVNTSSGRARSLDVKTRQKSKHETPNREKDKVCASPKSMNCSRSRSGRSLMPRLEFWRNQRGVYEADGTLTGIEGISPDQQGKGSSSSSRTKRRKLR